MEGDEWAAGDGRSASGAWLKFEPNEALAPDRKAQAAIKIIAIHEGGRCAAGCTASNVALLALRSDHKDFSAQKALGRQSPQLTNPEPGN